MNLFKFEFIKFLKSVLIWSFSICVMYILFMAFFPVFSKDASISETLLENFPEEMLKAFGMNSSLPISSVFGYISFLFPFVQLCLAIQASNYGFGTLSIEERELTADFLMTKPISRTTIYRNKALAGITSLLITAIITILSVLLANQIYADGFKFSPKILGLFSLGILIFQLAYFSVGLLISLSVKKVRNVLSFSMALSFGTYVISAIGGIVGGKVLKLFTPFYYVDSITLFETNFFPTPHFWIGIIVIISALIGSYTIYINRNIPSV